MLFHYNTGEEVCEGDLIRYWGGVGGIGTKWFDATIKQILAPGSQVSETSICENGGIFIEVDWDGKLGVLFEAPKNGILDEDYQLVKRTA